MAHALVVADIGNSTIDVAEFNFEDKRSDQVPRPTRTTKLDLRESDSTELSNWLSRPHDCEWIIGSVNEPARQRLVSLLADFPDKQQIRTICHSGLPLQTAVQQPHAVGIDRLAAALAANRLRNPNRPAIVICSGSAITVNIVSKDGVFLGGMITPGLQMSSECLSNNTDQLPAVAIKEETPPLIGDDTASAIRSGTFWTTVEGIDGIVSRLEIELAGECDVFATGGSMPSMLPHFSHDVLYDPHLVLSGLAMATP